MGWCGPLTSIPMVSKVGNHGSLLLCPADASVQQKTCWTYQTGGTLCETPRTVSGSHGHLYIFCMLVGGPAKNPNLNKLRERRGVFTQPTALPRSFSTSLPPPSSFLLAALPQNPPLFPPSHYSLLFCATQIFLGYCVCKQNVQRNTTVQ